MERFAEEDRLEQLNAQRRRIKVAEHAREVERLVAQKRAMYQAARVRNPKSQITKISTGICVGGHPNF